MSKRFVLSLLLSLRSVTAALLLLSNGVARIDEAMVDLQVNEIYTLGNY
jgi:hypothetical protein